MLIAPYIWLTNRLAYHTAKNRKDEDHNHKTRRIFRKEKVKLFNLFSTDKLCNFIRKEKDPS